jgi:hypothetical protein
MAGFEVITYGRFWVIAEEMLNGLLATAQVTTLKSFGTGCIQGILAIG